MYMNKLKLLTMIAAAGVVSAFGVADALAATCSVPGDHPTIQSAVNDPVCTTINVAPGLYNENVTVNRTVTINGAQAGNPVAGRVSGGPGESTVNGANPFNPFITSPVFQINAPDVNIDGFTIKNPVALNAATGIDVKTAGNDAVITNNIFDMITTPDLGGNGTAQAVYLENGPDNVNISNNEMKNIQSNRSAKGVLIGDNGGFNPSQNVLIKGNSIHDIASASRGAYGVSVANVPGVSGLKIQSNTLNNLNGGGWVHAIGLEGDTPGVMVTDNDISNLNGASPDKVAVWFESNPSFGSAQVHTNNFNVTAAAYGIAVHPALTGGSVNGTCNWWNSPSGPTAPSNPGGTGAQVSPNVTYAPWLIAPAPGGSCFGGNVPTTKEQCKNGGWTMSTRADGSTFKNQGDCIQYVNTGK
jgi:hypothetical protein